MEKRTLALKYLVGISLLLAISSNSEQAQANEAESPKLIIDDIKCTGNNTTDCDFITKKYYQNVGDVLNPDEIEDAKLRLGTLIQFKSTRIHLEKGSQRGYVVVVFDITEASNIQYDVGYSYQETDQNKIMGFCPRVNTDIECASSKIENDISENTLSGKVTNFNFMGKGKELSVSINKNYSNSKQNITTDADILLYFPEFNFLKGAHYQYDDDNNYYKLDYYDPHLLDSAKYYFRTSIGKMNNFSEYTGQEFENGPGRPIITGSSKHLSKNIDMSLGRRFASHSFVSFNIGYNSNARPKNSYTLDYGWNSEDDLLFPTRGSAFLSKINYNSYSKSLGMSYKENFSVATNKVVSLGIDTGIKQVHNLSSSNFYKSGELFARFTNITQVDKTSGVYSGWHASLNLGHKKWNNSLAATTNLSFNAGYTYQTESMIYRLSLGYINQEDK